MNCEYPCHVCDPEAWAEDNKPAPYNFAMKYEYALLKLELLFYAIEAAQVRPGVPLWWELWSPWPDDWYIDREVRHEDIGPYHGSMSTTTMVINDRYYIKDRLSSRRWPIIQYRQRVVDWDKRIAVIDGIYASHPPEFGVWMPSLRNP